MIENLPGIESLGPMTGKLGRHGIGVGLTQHGVRDVLIFDPATSAVLERERDRHRPLADQRPARQLALLSEEDCADVEEVRGQDRRGLAGQDSLPTR